jgi:hypothetical protein
VAVLLLQAEDGAGEFAEQTAAYNGASQHEGDGCAPAVPLWDESSCLFRVQQLKRLAAFRDDACSSPCRRFTLGGTDDNGMVQCSTCGMWFLDEDPTVEESE